LATPPSSLYPLYGTGASNTGATRRLAEPLGDDSAMAQGEFSALSVAHLYYENYSV
jgi:hypothetical protein